MSTTKLKLSGVLAVTLLFSSLYAADEQPRMYLDDQELTALAEVLDKTTEVMAPEQVPSCVHELKVSYHNKAELELSVAQATLHDLDRCLQESNPEMRDEKYANLWESVKHLEMRLGGGEKRVLTKD